MLVILNDVLDFSKIEAGKLQMESIDFSLRQMLDDTLKPFALRAHEKQCELMVDIRPLVPDALIGDPHRLRQVQKLRLTGERRKPGVSERRQERGSASIENWRFRAIHLDREIVDPHSRNSGENMLHRVNRVFALAELRTTLAGSDLTHVRPDARSPHTIHTAEHDSLA